jgi:hypothetical protein
MLRRQKVNFSPMFHVCSVFSRDDPLAHGWVWPALGFPQQERANTEKRKEVLSMSKLLVRWTFGEWAKKRTSPQAFSMLRASIEFAKMIFPEADFLLCCNRLYWSKAEIEDLVVTTGVPLFDALPYLPDAFLTAPEQKNYFWKFAPSRLNPDGFELVLDNDVILWRRPVALEHWLNEGGLLAGSDWTKCYGEYADEVNEADPDLYLNSGILGWPPGFIPSLDGVKPGEFGLTEQGFAALLFAQYSGPKRQVPWEDVPLAYKLQTRQNPRMPQSVLKTACGAHFCQCTYGNWNEWNRYYQAPIEAYLAESKALLIHS